MKRRTDKMQKILNIVREESGETLFEVITSIALFGLVMLMVAAMFMAADKSMLRNLKTDETVDKNVSAVIVGGNSDFPLEDLQTQQITFQETGGGTATRSVHLEKCGALYRFK